ncbi:type III restriction endonuclease subunit R [Desulfonema ishimotonii]|uniref:Type III restriction endonuclease subunit R n=2 Tax=Desulfonema ishimotonii TaxID=45657 RepID=A0A401G4L3_9BACT|nr:type III restriction endonuclease subunit R [Desulfonema ishimotonii]
MPERKTSIDKLIISSPFGEPEEHWHYIRETREFERRKGRRPAGYVVAGSSSGKGFDDPGTFIRIELVNLIRPRVRKWRESGYPGVTATTRKLLEHWRDESERDLRFFFCQWEAIETVIWLTEAPASEKVGIEIPRDGGDFVRWCCKMATGTGKTVIMAMLIAWQVLNKVSYPKDTRFSRNVFVVAPGLTVRSRLAVLRPSDPENYYAQFNIVPRGMTDRLRQGRIQVENWHRLSWESEEKIAKKKGADKRGAKSDTAYCKEVLGDMATAKNIIVINDEAHHAWRVNPDLKVKRAHKEQAAEATVWVGGLDRIHRKVGILRCFDLSATPFAPSGKKSDEEALFGWIVSDFGLNDAIESGLVKTPRVVIRDNARREDKELRSWLYHIYMDNNIKENLNRKQAEKTEPLPDLLTNAYYLLGQDWLETLKAWQEAGHTVPPVMITVANRTETSARIRHTFDHNQILIPELCDPDRTLQIDSRVLGEAESQTDAAPVGPVAGENDAPKDRKLTKKQQAELLRQMVDTVGQEGRPGEQVRNVISVGMLSEGWDARTVTHIMGLRAFSSQLLCEQVVGRGLRRMSYDLKDDGMFDAEYVNIFGVPFSFLPHENDEGGEEPPPPPPPSTKIEPAKAKKDKEISWPNVVRIDRQIRPVLSLDQSRMKKLVLDPYEKITDVQLGAIIGGKPSMADLTEIDLNEVAEKFRLQTIIFETAKRIFNSEKPEWRGCESLFLVQLIRITEQFVSSDKIVIRHDLFSVNRIRKRILMMLNMNRIVQHIWDEIRAENTEKSVLVLDNEHEKRRTGQMRTWHTKRPCKEADKTHISFVVCDGGWESLAVKVFEDHPLVERFVKNDHLGFGIFYNYQGITRKYLPDFIVKLTNGTHLVLEIKGRDSEQNRTKRKYLDEWVSTVNENGNYGKWAWDVAFLPGDVAGILERVGGSS